MKIISKQEAKAQGLHRYFTGIPCKKGHIAERYTSNNGCTLCSYLKCTQWRHNNVGKNREYQKKYYIKNIVKLREKNIKYSRTYLRINREQINTKRRANNEKSVAYGREWRDKNREKHILTQRKRYWKNPEKHRKVAREFRSRHLEDCKERYKKWCKENLDKLRVYAHKRRAMEQNAGGTYKAKDVQWLLEKQKYKCVYCGRDLKKVGYHTDHYIALSKGGRNDRENLQMLCPRCNSQKGAKDPIEFAKTKGFLL